MASTPTRPHSSPSALTTRSVWPAGIVSGLECSPDGAELGFTLSRGDAPSDAYSLNLSTGKLTRWTYSETGGIDPSTFIAPQLKTHFDFIEGELSRSPWFAGDDFAAADVMMWCCIVALALALGAAMLDATVMGNLSATPDQVFMLGPMLTIPFAGYGLAGAIGLIALWRERRARPGPPQKPAALPPMPPPRQQAWRVRR